MRGDAVAEDSFREDSPKLWSQALNDIFPHGIPSSSRWSDIANMSAVLAAVGQHANVCEREPRDESGQEQFPAASAGGVECGAVGAEEATAAD